jgi:hypothetical protein
MQKGDSYIGFKENADFVDFVPWGTTSSMGDNYTLMGQLHQREPITPIVVNFTYGG